MMPSPEPVSVCVYVCACVRVCVCACACVCVCVYTNVQEHDSFASLVGSLEEPVKDDVSGVVGHRAGHPAHPVTSAAGFHVSHLSSGKIASTAGGSHRLHAYHHQNEQQHQIAIIIIVIEQ
jgi:hypothetical protein